MFSVTNAFVCRVYAHGQDVRMMMSVLTGRYRDLAKNRPTIVSVDYNFKKGMVSESFCVCQSVLYCLLSLAFIYLAVPPSVFVLCLYLIADLFW